MTDALFSFETDKGAANAQQPSPIRPDQVQEIREAFVKVGIEDQVHRKAVIEGCVRRGVSTVRDLYESEARLVVNRILREANAKPKNTGSAWDNREEDTWIDKL